MKKAITFFAVLSIFTCAAAQEIQLNMSLLGRWDAEGLPTAGAIKYNDIWGYTDCSGREYAIMGSARNVHFLDVSVPSNPVEVGRFEGSVNSIWRDMKTYGHYAYAVADQGSDGLMVFDLSGLPDTVVKVGQYTEHFLTSHNIFIDVAQGRLYIVGSNSRSNGVIVMDLRSNPAEPQLLASIPLPGGYVHDIYVRDNIAYCSHGNQGLGVYGLTDPNNLINLGSLTSYPEQGYNHSSWLVEDGSKLVFADETHGRSLKLADVSNPAEITILDLFKSGLLAPAATNSIAHNPFVRGHYAIVSYYHDGVQVFDLSNPGDVQRVAYYDTYPENQNYNGYEGCWGVYPFLPSGNIIASDITHGLFVLSADSIEFEPPPALDASFTAEIPDTLCEGDTVLLTAMQQGLYGYQWLKDGEPIEADGPTLTLSSSGAYTLMVSNGICTDTSEAVDILFMPQPQAELPDSSITFCGDVPPSIFTPSSGDWYIWYLEGQEVAQGPGQWLDITASGAYQVEVISGGCSALSNEEQVILGVMPTPAYSLEYPSTLCLGSDSILLILPDEPGQWYTVATAGEPGIDTIQGNTYAFEANGVYSLHIYNEHCSLDVSLALDSVFHEPIIPAITANGNVLTASESSAYQWYLDNEALSGPEAQQQVYEALESGAYYVEVVDENGCTATSGTITLVVNAVSELSTQPIRVFPNPAGQHISLQAAVPILEVRLYSLSGSLLLSRRGEHTNHLEVGLSQLPPGQYILEAILEGQAGKYMIIKR
ncbi:MAG: choice-of-anchor B family protein [Lewinellaceae bacterium]|nr:choice-of-anchor B family protein [Lewinellaceae bacterium]